MEIGSRIPPDVNLVSTRTGDPLRWGQPSLVAAVLVLAGERAPARYLESVRSARERAERLGGRFTVVGADAGEGIDAVDRGGKLRQACGLSPSDSALLITDRWGEIYEIVTPSSGKPWPDAKELEDWFFYIATQCPECGVLDDGSRDWSKVL